MNNPKVRAEVRPQSAVQASIERSLVEHAEVWRLLAAYDNGTLTKEEQERINKDKKDLLSKYGPVV